MSVGAAPVSVNEPTLGVIIVWTMSVGAIPVRVSDPTLGVIIV